MGNKSSTNSSPEMNVNNDLKPKSISQNIDYIASHYILTMNFESLKRLHEKEYCDKLVILTSDIIEKYFTPLEISYLVQRTQNKMEINQIENDKIIFFNKDQINKLDVQPPLKKMRVCIGIAKFYIKIAHIFASIVMAINPVYQYTDTITGNIVKIPLYEKNKIPSNVPREILKLNICNNRIDALTRGYKEKEGNNITINPSICSLNNNSTTGKVKTLLEEPGIPEIKELYYDDLYDIKTGKFLGMTEETKKEYNEDLRIFYNIFTGNNVTILPENIKSFSDILLNDYSKESKCQGSNPVLDSNVSGSLSNKLFAEYANNITKMIKNTNENQQKLLDIINKLFSYSINSQTNQKEIHINPNLNETNIQEIIIETRAILMNLYLTCEIDYLNGVKIYEAIVDKKILDTSQNQIGAFTKLSDSLLFPNLETDKIPSNK